jgi:hypothetical protein
MSHTNFVRFFWEERPVNLRVVGFEWPHPHYILWSVMVGIRLNLKETIVSNEPEGLNEPVMHSVTLPQMFGCVISVLWSS